MNSDFQTHLPKPSRRPATGQSTDQQERRERKAGERIAYGVTTDRVKGLSTSAIPHASYVLGEAAFCLTQKLLHNHTDQDTAVREVNRLPLNNYNCSQTLFYGYKPTTSMGNGNFATDCSNPLGRYICYQVITRM